MRMADQLRPLRQQLAADETVRINTDTGDPIEALITRIRELPELQSTRFTASFLNDVADVFERHGFGVTEAYLLEKRERSDLRSQAGAVMTIVRLMANEPMVSQHRSIGRLLIKTLVALKTHQGPRPDRKGASNP